MMLLATNIVAISYSGLRNSYTLPERHFYDTVSVLFLFGRVSVHNICGNMPYVQMFSHISSFLYEGN